MDDPNSALPSDPSVDESYTKSSRPARPRAWTLSHPSFYLLEPQYGPL